MTLYFLIGLFAVGLYSVFHLLRAFLYWEIKWDLRLIRLIIHAALFGAAATVVLLLYFGLLKY